MCSSPVQAGFGHRASRSWGERADIRIVGRPCLALPCLRPSVGDRPEQPQERSTPDNRRPRRLLDSLDALRCHREIIPRHPRRYGRGGGVELGPRMGHAEASAISAGAGPRLVYRLPVDRLGLLPLGRRAGRSRDLFQLAPGWILAARRQTRRRSFSFDAHPVLQFSGAAAGSQCRLNPLVGHHYLCLRPGVSHPQRGLVGCDRCCRRRRGSHQILVAFTLVWPDRRRFR